MWAGCVKIDSLITQIVNDCRNYKLKFRPYSKTYVRKFTEFIYLISTFYNFTTKIKQLICAKFTPIVNPTSAATRFLNNVKNNYGTAIKKSI